MKRGDICTALVQFAGGSTPKARPMLVVQSDFYNHRLQKVILAPITSNLARASDPAHLLIDVSTPEGALSGLRTNSLISCLNLIVLPQADVRAKIGELSTDLMIQVDECLRQALGL